MVSHDKNGFLTGSTTETGRGGAPVRKPQQNEQVFIVGKVVIDADTLRFERQDGKAFQTIAPQGYVAANPTFVSSLVDRGIRVEFNSVQPSRLGSLGAFALGLIWHLEAGAHVTGNPITYLIQHDWRGIDVQTAETMAFVTLSLCELFRAYTVRSERASIYKIGVFSNRYMQYAVGLSIVLLILVCAVPFLQPIFNTHFLAPREWLVVVGFALIPAIAEEITKAYLRSQDAKQKIAHQHVAA